MSSSQIIVLVTPVFLLAIVAEWAWSQRRGTPSYQLDDAINSVSLGMLSQITGVLGGLVSLGIYTLAYRHLALVQADAFWGHPLGWGLALVAYDFCYYWHHRKSHEVAVLWAAHSVHHQSQSYNLSTALRQTSTGFVFGWLFYLPMALAGVPPLVFAVVALVDLLYQFWVHTEQVGRLGRFDRWLCSPSNHRVHHGVNDRYLDRNHGGILMVWDHLFGTFEPEDPAEPCVYGTRSPLNSWNPLWANAQGYVALWQTAQRARRWTDKLQVWLRPPGWLPADLRAPTEMTPFDPRAMPRFASALTPTQRQFAALQFGLLLSATAAFLWWAPGWGLPQQATGLLGLAVAFWAQGAHLQGRVNAWACLAVQAAVLSTLSATWGWQAVHLVTKPLALTVFILYIANKSLLTFHKSLFIEKKRWLLAAAIFSLTGDVLLMGPSSWFVPGLGAFWVAHACYLGLMTRDTAWWPRPGALVFTGSLGLAMLVVLWPGLPSGLHVPVVLYVGVIAAMAGQALGRAAMLGSTHARRMAVGAVAFLISDALLGFNRFVMPLPWSPLGVLGAYYLAQALLVLNALPTPALAANQPPNKSPVAAGGNTPRWR